MSEPYLAEIRIFGFNFAPRGWAMCDGQILPINQNQSLYSLLGTTYGGDGRTTFALPDLRSRVPIHEDNNHRLGYRSGEETHTLSAAEMPNHTHTVQVFNGDGNQTAFANTVLAQNPAASGGASLYDSENNGAQMAGETVSNAGGGQAHENMQPFLTLNFCIALQGIFPPRN